MVVSYGTDIPNLEGDHTRYLYGPGSILVAHSKDEFVTIQDLQDSVKGYKKLIREALHPSKGKGLEPVEIFQDNGDQKTFVADIVETVVLQDEVHVTEL
jgi:hypothetical protein